MELYVSWRERSEEVGEVYRRWGRAADPGERAVELAAYWLALDEEEMAAVRFADFSRRATKALAA